MLLNFLTRGVKRFPAALFPCLSSTNLMRINFNKHIAGLTVSPVALADPLDFLFPTLGVDTRLHSAYSGTCVAAFHPRLMQRS